MFMVCCTRNEHTTHQMIMVYLTLFFLLSLHSIPLTFSFSQSLTQRHFFCSLCRIFKQNQYINLTDIIKNWELNHLYASWLRRCHFLVHCCLFISYFFFCFTQFVCSFLYTSNYKIYTNTYKLTRTHTGKWNVATKDISQMFIHPWIK